MTVAVTLDIDWAPDFVIDEVAERLVETNCQATWFVTHDSPAVRRLRDHTLFELGIHPNFHSHSTHGDSPKQVLEHCMKLVPEAIAMRTHGLMQSAHLLAEVLEHTPVQLDLSLFIPDLAPLAAHEYWWSGRCLLRQPYNWDDHFETHRPRPRWEAERILQAECAVINFHPLHVYLNTVDRQQYAALKRRVPDLTEVTAAQADEFVMTGPGPRSVFWALTGALATDGGAESIHYIVRNSCRMLGSNLP